MKSVYYTALILLITSCAYSQSIPNNSPIMPSPTASSLGKYINNYANSSTGAINTSIPIFSIKSGMLTDNISLDYSSTGFRPAEIPGWTGLGWSLDCGGVITRIVRGLPDDYNQYGYLSKLTDQQMLDNNLRTGSAISDVTFDAINNNQFDYQPDLYSFHVGKYSGQFYIDNTGTIRTIPYLNLQITYSRADNTEHGVTSCIDQWIIATPEGQQYTFSDKEWSLTPTTIGTQPADIKNVSSWYLTNTLSEKGDQINYFYQSTPNTYRYQEYPFEQYGFSNCSNSVYPNNVSSKSPTWTEVLYLSQIESNTTTIKFFKSERNDLYQEHPIGVSYTLKDYQLDSIAIYRKTDLVVPLKTFAIKYDGSLSRLSPMEFRQYAYNSSQFISHRFYYNTFPAVPYTSHDIDHWGYYNGAGNSSYVPETNVNIPELNIQNQIIGDADRGVNTFYTGVGQLNKIIYPTGGETTFEYEPNDFSTIGGSAFYKTVYQSINSARGIKYYTPYETDVDETFTVLHNATMTAVGYAEINDGHDCLQEQIPLRLTKTFSAGTYSVSSAFMTDAYNQIDYRKSGCLYRILLDVRGKDYYVSNVEIGGGARLKKITNYDGASHSKDIITTYNYTTNQNNGTIMSTGTIGLYPDYSFFLDPTSYSANYCNAVFILRSSTINNIPLTQGNYLNYSKIEEVRSDNSKTVKTYSSFDDYADDPAEFQIPGLHPFGPTTKRDYLRGNLLNTQIFNSQGQLLQETKNTYTVSSLNSFSQYLWSIIPHFVQGPPFQSPQFFFIGGAPQYTTWFYPSKQETIRYDSGSPLSTVHNYYYDNPSSALLTRDVTNNSDGKLLTHLNIYGNEYSPFTYFTNGGDKPIEQVTFITDNAGTRIVSGTINEYGEKSLLNKTLTLKLPTPVNLPDFKFSSASQGVLPYPSTYGNYVHDGKYEERINYGYDSSGNPREIAAVNGPSITYLWSYNKEYPIAEIKNATYASVLTALSNAGINVDNIADQSSVTTTDINNIRNAIKLALPAAQITTYTYAPLIGMTSSTDAKGQTSYYEYDSFQRLMNVKDKDGNIIKHTDYHYANQ